MISIVWPRPWLLVAMILVTCLEHEGYSETATEMAEDEYTVACYYFPNYHPNDARNTEQKGRGWSEWELVKNARPRFEGHQQPKMPQWGYTDESDPQVMAQKIDAAADHGIDALIFDWYWFNDGPFLERALDEGFLKAKNNHRLKFALMWANHDWNDIHPYTRGRPQDLLYPGKVTRETFDALVEHCIDEYFLHPSYWKIEGKPYFSIYHISSLLESFGGIEETRLALDSFRARCREKGLPGLHLNLVVWGQPILPGEGARTDHATLVKQLGFDSVTSYVWIHHVPLPEMKTDYVHVQKEYFNFWDGAFEKFQVPYFPNVSMGWDPSPRADQEQEYGHFGYPFMNTISGNTPERFEQALLAVKDRLDKLGGPRVLNINCWNEWTEGSYLEPDSIHGMQYLEAVRKIFGKSGSQNAEAARKNLP